MKANGCEKLSDEWWVIKIEWRKLSDQILLAKQALSFSFLFPHGSNVARYWVFDSWARINKYIWSLSLCIYTACIAWSNLLTCWVLSCFFELYVRIQKSSIYSLVSHLFHFRSKWLLHIIQNFVFQNLSHHMMIGTQRLKDPEISSSPQPFTNACLLKLLLIKICHNYSVRFLVSSLNAPNRLKLNRIIIIYFILNI